ncbi:hypothetical protein GCM10022240_27960 [Microbacterium kribbense]|uniref:Probable 2-phosphosulfolactate phosphatase n=1 Tax=Microbacterium kribbense TaxID=433645 RepID=A0ABP7GS70_9MICO
MAATSQSFFQVRFDWGLEGLARLAPADIVVIVDVLGLGTDATGAVADGRPFALDSAVSEPVAALARAAAASGALVLAGCLRNPTAVARAVLAEQHRRGVRVSVSVLAAGEVSDSGALRVAVEDQLGAGAVVDALAAVGLDHSSPEAAVAGIAFGGLRGALRHLLLASSSGQELVARGLADYVRSAAALEAADAVAVLQDGVFIPRS